MSSVTDGVNRTARETPAERRRAVLFFIAVMIVWTAFSIWHGREAAPRHERMARQALAVAGYRNVELRHDHLLGCGRGHWGYRWKTESAKGTVCDYYLQRPGHGVRVTKPRTGS